MTSYARKEELVSIQIYLPDDEKDRFKKACRIRQASMSFELRRFIRAYANTPYIDDRVYYAPLKSQQ